MTLLGHRKLRSRRGKFIYNKPTIQLVQIRLIIFLDAVVHLARLPMKKLKSLLKKTRIVRLSVWKGILKNTPLSSKIHCYFKNRNSLYLNRYRSNCKSVRFLLSASPKFVRKQGKVYLSSKQKRRGRGYLGGMRYQNRVLSKYWSL